MRVDEETEVEREEREVGNVIKETCTNDDEYSEKI